MYFRVCFELLSTLPLSVRLQGPTPTPKPTPQLKLKDRMFDEDFDPSNNREDFELWFDAMMVRDSADSSANTDGPLREDQRR